jgi:hypothetical protein
VEDTSIKIKLTASTGMSTQNKTLTLDQTTLGNAEHAEGKESMEKTIWTCERCGMRVTLYVTPSQAPTHVCPKAVNKTKPLKKEGETQ